MHARFTLNYLVHFIYSSQTCAGNYLIRFGVETMPMPLLLLSLLLLFQLQSWRELRENAFFHTDLTLTDKLLFWDPTIFYCCLVALHLAALA